MLAGFVTIGAVIGLGALLAQWRILDVDGQKTLVRLSFFVASPALVVTVLGRHRRQSDLLRQPDRLDRQRRGRRIDRVLLARLVWRRTVGDIVIGAFGSAYVNAGNLGCPSPRTRWATRR